MAIDPSLVMRQTYASSMAGVMEAMSRAEAPAAVPARGEIFGEGVVLEADPLAELEDSMEELSFQFEEKALKRASERKMGEMQGPRSSLVRAVETWLSMMPDMPGREFLSRAARNLRNSISSGAPMDARELLKELARGSTDPSHQFAMLDILEQAFGSGETSAADIVRRAKTLLMQEKGAEVRAGVNLAAEVNARASTPEEMQSLRDLYRSETIGFTTPQQCFRSLMAARGPEGLKNAIDFLLAGCGADLQSPSPSQSPEELRRITLDLQCVQVLQTVLEKFDGLRERMGTQFAEKCLMDAAQMTGRTVDLTERQYVESSEIAAFIGACGMSKLLARMDFARELVRLFRMLSPRMFAREGDRARLVDAAQEHLDGLIEEEDRYGDDSAGKEAS